MPVYPGQYTRSRRTQDARHAPGAPVEDHRGRTLVYGCALAECTVGQIAAPNLYATITSGITAAANTTTFTSSGSTFVVEVKDRDGNVTTVGRPLRGTILHVAGGTGKQQYARVTNVLTTTKLGVQVIGREGSTYGGSWGTALAATDVVRLIEPYFAPYDISSHDLPPIGYCLPDTIEAESWGFFGNKGIFRCLPNSVSEGTEMIVGTTAGQIEPAVMFGSASWTPGTIADGDEVSQDITVTGAALGDFATVAFSLDVADGTLTGDVVAANTVAAQIGNFTGANLVLTVAGTVYAKVDARTALTRHAAGTLISAPQTAAESGLVACDLLPSLFGQWAI